MDALEAFYIGVKIYRSGDWSPALPTFNKVKVRGEYLTLREVCNLIEHVRERLPDSVVSNLFTSLRSSHPRLAEELVVDRTYASGARCLLRLMDESESALRRKEGQVAL